MHTYDQTRHTWRYDVGGYAWDNGELCETFSRLFPIQIHPDTSYQLRIFGFGYRFYELVAQMFTELHMQWQGIYQKSILTIPAHLQVSEADIMYLIGVMVRRRLELAGVLWEDLSITWPVSFLVLSYCE